MLNGLKSASLVFSTVMEVQLALITCVTTCTTLSFKTNTSHNFHRKQSLVDSRNAKKVLSIWLKLLRIERNMLCLDNKLDLKDRALVQAWLW